MRIHHHQITHDEQIEVTVRCAASVLGQFISLLNARLKAVQLPHTQQQ